MHSLIKDSFRQFIIFFLALGAVLLVATVVRAANWTGPTAAFPGGNVSWPVNCSGTQVVMTDASGNLTCGTPVATYN